MGESELEIAARAGAAPVASRAEARLRRQVAELEARLAEVTRCLDDAEHRAAELLSITERAKQLEAQLATANQRLTAATAESERIRQALELRHVAITSSRSWRLTRPLRSATNRARGFLGR